MIRILVLSVTIAVAAEAVQKEGSAAVGKVQGRITERETGSPVGRLRVGLVRKSYSRDGVQEPTLFASAETDDDGNYTILARPGRYSVATAAQTADGAVYIPQYFPGFSDASSSLTLNVSAGMELHDINIAVPRGNHVNVGGRLLDGLGRSLPHFDWVWLVPRHPIGGEAGPTPRNWRSWQSRYRNAARYEISGIAPGLYYLMSWRFDDISQRAETVIPIEVGTSDVEVDVISYRGYIVTGRFRFQGTSAFSLTQPNSRAPTVQILARSRDGSPLSNPGATLHRTGMFSFSYLPAGSYRLSILDIPAPFYVKSVRMGSGPDVLDVGFTVPGRTESMEVLIAGDGAEVRGTVHEGGDSTVVLIPEGRPMLRADLYKTVQADKSGAFVIRGIAPGAYRLFAWKDISGNVFFDPDYLKPFISLGTPVTIAAGSVIGVDLAVTKP